MMQFLWVYIDELVGKGLSLGVILEFMMWGGCTILPLALPLSTLLASMMTLGQMGENNELMAIKAAGISITRVMLPVMISSVAISVGAFFAGNDLVPKAFNEIYTLRDDIGRTKDEIKIPSGTFYDGIDGYVLRVDGYTENTGMMKGVMVYDHTARKGNVSVTLADSATMKMSDGKDYLIFTLYNGYNYQESNEITYRDTVLDLQKINFSKQQLVIPLAHYAFEKSDSGRFGDQAKSMRLSQLIEVGDSLDRELVQQHESHYRYFASSIFLAHSSQLDTSFAREGKTAFAPEVEKRWRTLDQQVDAYSTAKANAERATAYMTNCSMDVLNYAFYLRRNDIELLKKFAQALACFILFFIGAPLGALIRKGGLGTSAIVSVLFFVLYWVIDISGTKLARDGAVSPSIGVFISAVILLPIGLFLTWKAIHDSDIFNMERFKSAFRVVRSRISGLFRKTRIVFMGTPEFAVASLDALVSRKYNVVGVVTVADKPCGRGLKVSESAVKTYAVEHGIPVLQPVRLKDPEFLAQLRAMKADLFVVVAFRMLPEEVWSMPRLGTFNLHAALLPQYRGAAPVNWAVINGERMTGVTTFMIDKDIDTGGIMFREEYRIKPTDTAGDVHDALMALGTGLVLQTVQAIEDHTVELRVQRSFIQGDEVLKGAPKITKETCRISWGSDAESVYNLVRGLSPYPGAFTLLERNADGSVSEQTQMKIYFGEVCEAAVREGTSAGNAVPGTILSDGKTYLKIICGDGRALCVTDLQIMGKRRMAIGDFLRGWRDPSSWRAV